MSTLVVCQCEPDRLGRRGSPQACDLHFIPVVCICDLPAPDGIGECQRCKRPYKPQVPGFDACREAWRAQLNQEAA